MFKIIGTQWKFKDWIFNSTISTFFCCNNKPKLRTKMSLHWALMFSEVMSMAATVILTRRKSRVLLGLALSVPSDGCHSGWRQSGLSLHADLWLIKRPFLALHWPGAPFVTWQRSPVEELLVPQSTFRLFFPLNLPNSVSSTKATHVKKSVQSLWCSAFWIRVNTKWHIRT